MEPMSPSSNPGQVAAPAKKKSGCGCGCFLTGCLILILMIVLPIVGGGVYVASLSDEDWGDKIIWLIKNDSFSTGFKNGVRNSKEMNEDEKKALIQVYEEIVESFDRLTPEQQAMVKKDLVIVIKTFIKNPEIKTPPKEFNELLQLLNPGMIDQTAPDAPTAPAPQEQPTQPSSNGNGNPYDFGPGGSTAPAPQTPPAPQEEPDAPAENGKFDF